MGCPFITRVGSGLTPARGGERRPRSRQCGASCLRPWFYSRPWGSNLPSEDPLGAVYTVGSNTLSLLHTFRLCPPPHPWLGRRIVIGGNWVLLRAVTEHRVDGGVSRRKDALGTGRVGGRYREPAPRARPSHSGRASASAAGYVLGFSAVPWPSFLPKPAPGWRPPTPQSPEGPVLSSSGFAPAGAPSPLPPSR